MSKDFVLITGASSGIGQATAVLLSNLGFYALAGVRTQEDAVRLQQMGGENLTPVILDVTVPATILEVRGQVEALVKGSGLAAVINNAGHNYNSAFEYSDMEAARRMMEVNFFGTVNVSQKFIPLLRKYSQTSGKTSKLINVGSIGSIVGIPWESFYHASKFAVLGLTESLRYELHAQGIRATAVLPGGIKTKFSDKTAQSVNLAVESLDAQGMLLYQKGLEKISENVSLVDRWGSEPEKVANRIASIIGMSNPNLKYLVGIDAHLIFAMARWLPTKLMHSIFRPAFGA